MSTLRFYLWPSVLAAAVLSAPFAVSVVLVSLNLAVLPSSLEAWFTILAYAVIADIIVAILPFVFYLLARISWREKERVVREHLFGWPLAFGIVCFLLAMLATALVDGLTVFWTVAYLIAGAAVAVSGVIASRIWLRLSYP